LGSRRTCAMRLAARASSGLAHRLSSPWSPVASAACLPFEPRAMEPPEPAREEPSHPEPDPAAAPGSSRGRAAARGASQPQSRRLDPSPMRTPARPTTVRAGLRTTGTSSATRGRGTLPSSALGVRPRVGASLGVVRTPSPVRTPARPAASAAEVDEAPATPSAADIAPVSARGERNPLRARLAELALANAQLRSEQRSSVRTIAALRSRVADLERLATASASEPPVRVAPRSER